MELNCAQWYNEEGKDTLTFKISFWILLKHYDVTQDPKINFCEYLDCFLENKLKMGRLIITWFYLSISFRFLFLFIVGVTRNFLIKNAPLEIGS